MKMILELYITFFRMGCIAFGGGYALLPIIQREIVENKKWAENDEIIDYFAVGQCTPGVIAVNVSTFIGYKKKGIVGSIISTLGFISPSIIIIAVIASFLAEFSHIKAVNNAFAGIRVCVCVLIFNAVLKIGKTGIKDKFTLLICLIVFAIAVATNISPIISVICSGAAGIIIKSIKKGEDIK